MAEYDKGDSGDEVDEEATRGFRELEEKPGHCEERVPPHLLEPFDETAHDKAMSIVEKMIEHADGNTEG